jgi:hypothetical protein
MTDRQFVLQRFPKAELSFHVRAGYYDSIGDYYKILSNSCIEKYEIIGIGNNAKDAWKNAKNKIKQLNKR